MSTQETADSPADALRDSTAHWVEIRHYNSGRAKARCMDCAAVWPTRPDWLTAYADSHAHEVTTGNEYHMCDCGDHAERPLNEHATRRRAEVLPLPAGCNAN